MGYRSYRGPVTTIQHALMAHTVVTVTCQRCNRARTMYAWRLYHAAGLRVFPMPLGKSLSGFWCKRCRQSVQVVVRAPAPWA
jgi:hypothetical protein